MSNLTIESRVKNWLWTFNNLNDFEKVFVAETEEGNIVGFSNGGRSRYHEYKHDGELYAIYLLKNYQRLGIGRMLFRSVVESLKENGCTSMMLWVLENNPAVSFYKSLGGRSIGRKTITIGGDRLVELAIGWDSL
ncbi:GNAT family N-acetyltransferase [Paenibacillus arenilitoris]|uniref:GNAT family N-acetyltransferase n=1 Tax=Paenibacillus arenilitoris TaxID=2772299 RepID=UPI001CC22C5E|nr:GNAT family N-acetyltransferase [Paenibacillus arenilitoris]